MKRSSLPRRTALRRAAMASRRTPLKRSTNRLRLRRPALSADEVAARLLVAERCDGLCEACPQQHPGVEWHHRVRRSQGGRWSGSNGLWLCRRLHSWITRHPRGARLLGWGLWSHEDSAAEPVLYRGIWVLLDDAGGVTPTQPPVLEVAS